MYKDVKGKWVADLGNGNYKNPILDRKSVV